MNLDRRRFLNHSALAAAATSTAGFAWSKPAFANNSPNDRPRIGCIGVGNMGRGDARGHAGFGDISVICDVDSQQAEKTRNDKRVKSPNAEIVTDYRAVIERNDIDVVSIVTPDHWHVKIAIEALEAGKHVFCQKPLTLTLEENQLIRNACRKHKEKTFFVGTQQRSTKDKFLRAVNLVQKGLIGKVKKVTVGINGGNKGGPFDKSDPPASLDWNMWQGQAPVHDYIKQRCHGTFRWWYEYSGGKFTDWGAHHVDIALWALNMNGDGVGPLSFDGTDAKHPVPYENGYATRTDSFNTAHDYAVKCALPGDIEMVITSRGDNGIMFEGTEGRFFVNRGKIVGQPIEAKVDKGQFGEEELTELYKGKPFEGHKANFYRCLSEGGLPVSDVYTHVQAMNTCHLAAISARLNRVIKWDAAEEKILDDPQAAEFFSREQRKGFEIPKI